MTTLRVIELFSGYGSQHNALKRLHRDYPQFNFEVVAICEIDRHAIKAYQSLHGDNIPNLGDITKVKYPDIPDCDLITWSFPCTDISYAGTQHGLTEGSGTHSSLCWNAIHIIDRKRPKYLIMENVPALVSSKFIADFREIQTTLLNFGYTNYTQIMNSKHYGIPQNRPRVFMVSILNPCCPYHYPPPIPLTRCLKDVLETNVPERYYLTTERLAGLQKSNKKEKAAGRGFTFRPQTANNSIAHAVTTNPGGRKTDTYIQEPCSYTNIKQAAQLIPNSHFANPQRGRIYSPQGIAPTIVTASGGNLVAKIIVQPNITHPSRGIIMINNNPYWVRRLTERELFRLMDVDDNDIDTLLSAGISNTQLAKLAGNSIVTACLYYIFKSLFIEKSTQYQLTLF